MQARRSSRRRADLTCRVIVVSGLAVFVVVVYVVVVVGIGALIGRADSPSVVLSVLATACVALGFGPVQRRLEAAARTFVHRGALTPYDLLRSFSTTITGGYATEDLPPAMARLLAEGTGAERAQVWLSVGGRLVLAAGWPPGVDAPAVPPDPRPALQDASQPGRRAATVRHGGALLGVLCLTEVPGRPLTSVEERLMSGLADQAGLVLRLAGLRAELAARHDELAARAEELRISRQRLIETQDAERRRLERDIHDGAQQHLVALAVNLRLAQTLSRRAPDRAQAVLAQQVDAARESIATLRQLSTGLYPRALAENGLEVALAAAAATSSQHVSIVSPGVTRYPPEIEAALYFCCVEALQNAAKHAPGADVTVSIGERDGRLLLEVADDGPGFEVDASAAGTGLTNMRDRLDSVGGAVTVLPRAGGGTRVRAVVPVSEPTAVPQQRDG